MSKHTPGPWSVYGSANEWPGIESGHYSVVIFGIKDSLDDSGIRGANLEEAKANARLIAAAPDLLEACVAMIEWDAREEDHAVDFHARMTLCKAAFQKARAAIAKATGERG